MSVTQAEFNEIIDLLGNAHSEFSVAKANYDADHHNYFDEDTLTPTEVLQKIDELHSRFPNPTRNEQPSYLLYIDKLNKLYSRNSSAILSWFRSIPAVYSSFPSQEKGGFTFMYGNISTYNDHQISIDIAPIINQLNNDFNSDSPLTYTGKYEHKVFPNAQEGRYYILVSDLQTRISHVETNALPTSQPSLLLGPSSRAHQRLIDSNENGLQSNTNTSSGEHTHNNSPNIEPSHIPSSFLMQVLSHPRLPIIGTILVVLGMGLIVSSVAVNLGIGMATAGTIMIGVYTAAKYCFFSERRNTETQDDLRLSNISIQSI